MNFRILKDEMTRGPRKSRSTIYEEMGLIRAFHKKSKTIESIYFRQDGKTHDEAQGVQSFKYLFLLAQSVCSQHEFAAHFLL